MEGELCAKVWYNRHMGYRVDLDDLSQVLVEKHSEKFTPQNSICREIWERALEAAKRVEKEYGEHNLGPWDDFDWGMINGKLSALRWVLGDEWDMLDT